MFQCLSNLTPGYYLTCWFISAHYQRPKCSSRIPLVTFVKKSGSWLFSSHYGIYLECHNNNSPMWYNSWPSIGDYAQVVSFGSYSEIVSMFTITTSSPQTPSTAITNQELTQKFPSPIHELYTKFHTIFSEPSGLLPLHTMDNQIHLVVGTKLVYIRPYHYP